MISEQEIPFTKILRPSLQEFSDFEEFVEELDRDKSLQNYGMFKVKTFFFILVLLFVKTLSFVDCSSC